MKRSLPDASRAVGSRRDPVGSRDKEKPFILMGAVLAGRPARLSYAEVTALAFTTTARNSEAVIGVAVSAFPGHTLVYIAIMLGPIVELPILLFLSQVMMGLRHLWAPEPVGATPE